MTAPMTTAEAERNFSTLKGIKTFLQSTMTTERLSALAMNFIENEMISGIIDFNEIVLPELIDCFARAKT